MGNRKKSSLSLQKFQKDYTQVSAINCRQRKEPFFSRKIHSGAGNCPIPASVEWGNLRRIRALRVIATSTVTYVNLGDYDSEESVKSKKPWEPSPYSYIIRISDSNQ
ncbi:hypothetical protein AVEN_87514-1, partial [Araneus ventricosus]